jgi:hypothetical protein
VPKTNQSNKGSQQAKSASKSKRSAKTEIRKKRGILLSSLLVIIFLHAILATFLVYSSLKQDYIGQKTGILVVMILISLADLIAAVGMWFWKQWGIYLYIMATIVVAAMSIVLTGSVWVSLYQFIPVAILGYVISLQNKQKLFE